MCFFFLLMVYSVRGHLQNVSQSVLPEVEDRIYEGYSSDIDRYPHATFLLFDIESPKSCGGSLIALQSVLTAAHCVDELKNKKITAFFGANIPRDSKVSRNVKDYKIHPKYNNYNGKMNLAVVFLSKPVKEERTIKKIKLSSVDPPKDQYVHSVGWGKQKFPKPPPNLKSYSKWRSLKGTKQQVIDRYQCSAYTGFNVSGTALCTISEKGYFYRDDAGNGLVWKKSSGRVLVAVLSYLTDDYDDGACFCTSVAGARKWIKETHKILKDRNKLMGVNTDSGNSTSRKYYCKLGAASVRK